MWITKHYCPSCGRTRIKFNYQITRKKDFDILTMECSKCKYKYHLFSKSQKNQWMRKKLFIKLLSMEK